MTPDQQAQLMALMQAQKWWLVGALALSLLLGAFVRLLKNDVTWTPTIPARYRPIVTTALGLLAGAFADVAGGVPLLPALLGGLMAGLLPVAGHELIVTGLRNGRDIGEPKGPGGGGAGRALQAVGMTLALGAILMGCTKREAKTVADEIAHDVNRTAIVCAALVPLVTSDVFDKACLAAQDIAPAAQDIARDIFGARKRDAIRRGLHVPE